MSRKVVVRMMDSFTRWRPAFTLGDFDKTVSLIPCVCVGVLEVDTIKQTPVAPVYENPLTHRKHHPNRGVPDFRLIFSSSSLILECTLERCKILTIYCALFLDSISARFCRVLAHL